MSTAEQRSDRFTPALSIRLIGAGAAIFASFVGVLNLASIVGHYGVEWHAGIAQLVAEYERTFYPFYDVFLRPAFGWLHIELTPLRKDIVTLFALAFSAANAESIIRDGRMLVQNLIVSIRDIFSDGGWRPHSMLSRALPLREGTDANEALGGLAMLAGLATLVFIDFKPIVGHRLSEIPLWYWRWLEIGFVIAFAIGLVEAFLSAQKLAAVPPDWVVTLIVLALLPLLPFLLYVVLFATASILVLLGVSAPLIAWRTAGTTIALFLAMLLLNFLIEKGVV